MSPNLIVKLPLRHIDFFCGNTLHQERIMLFLVHKDYGVHKACRDWHSSAPSNSKAEGNIS